MNADGSSVDTLDQQSGEGQLRLVGRCAARCLFLGYATSRPSCFARLAHLEKVRVMDQVFSAL